VPQKPDGKPAGVERTSFTKSSAERIAKAVRKVEAGNRDTPGIGFGVRLQGVAKPSVLTLATYSGAWQIGSYKTVTLYGSQETALVKNWCQAAGAGNTNNITETRYVIFSPIKGTNSVIEIQTTPTSSSSCTHTLTLGSVDLSAIPGYDFNVIQMLGHSEGQTASTCSGGLRWYSITTCSTATSS
jgi:hypothetical protein